MIMLDFEPRMLYLALDPSGLERNGLRTLARLDSL